MNTLITRSVTAIGILIWFLLLVSCSSDEKEISLFELHSAALVDEDQLHLTPGEDGAGSFYRSFHPPSDTGRVIHGSEAYFAFNAVSTTPRRMDMTLRVPPGGGTVRVFSRNNILVGEETFSRGSHILSCQFTGNTLHRGRNHLRISWMPHSGVFTNDNRLIVLRGDFRPLTDTSKLSFAAWDTSGSSLEMGPGCTYGIFVVPSADGRIKGSVSGRNAGAIMVITDDRGRKDVLWESGNLTGDTRFECRFPFWTTSTLVEIRLRSAVAGGPVTWSDIRLSGVSDSPYRLDSQSTQRLPRPDPEKDQLNVLLYLVDTVRKDRLQIYGYEKPTTPHLQESLNEWLVFDDCQSMSSWTKPSTATLLTGLDPVEHGINAEDDSLKAHVRLIWGEAHDAGYETSCFITNGHIREKWGFGRDVDHFEYFPPQRWRRGYTLQADSLHGSILEWIDSRTNPDRPFFCYVHASDPHAPYAPPPDYFHSFYPSLPETITAVSGQEVNKLNCPAGTYQPWQPMALSALYDAEIAAWESDFNDLLNELKLRGILDRTIVVLTSDHGEEFADHGMFFHGRTLYNEQIDVPLLVRIPGKGGVRYQTTMDLADVGDLLAWIFDTEDPRDWQPSDRAGRPSLVLWRGFQRARFESDDLSIIWNISPLKACNLDAPEIEVFDSDPFEQTSVAEEYEVTARACRAALNEWWSRRLEDHHVSVELDTDTIEMLKMLGYMSDD